MVDHGVSPSPSLKSLDVDSKNSDSEAKSKDKKFCVQHVTSGLAKVIRARQLGAVAPAANSFSIKNVVVSDGQFENSTANIDAHVQMY